MVSYLQRAEKGYLTRSDSNITQILEVARQLQTAIKQQPEKAPMDEIIAIKLLREVLLGENRATLPPNSIQVRKQAQDESAKAPSGSAAVTPNEATAPLETNKSPPNSATTKTNEAQPISATPNAVNDNGTNDDQPAYISDGEDEKMPTPIAREEANESQHTARTKRVASLVTPKYETDCIRL